MLSAAHYLLAEVRWSLAECVRWYCDQSSSCVL